MKLSLFLLLAGCDGVFHLDAVHAPVIDAQVPVDMPLDAVPPPCMNPLDDVETFDDPNRICPWGFFDPSCNNYVVANGALSMTTTVGQTGQCGCGAFAYADFDGYGQFIEIEAIGSAYEYLFFALHWSDGTSSSTLGRNGTLIQFAGPGGPDLGHVEFDPSTTRWLRMRPAVDRKSVIAEYSGDAQTWNLIGTDPTPAPPGVKVEFEYGAPGPGETMSSTAILDGINACP
jgi:hypothetical protein